VGRYRLRNHFFPFTGHSLMLIASSACFNCIALLDLVSVADWCHACASAAPCFRRSIIAGLRHSFCSSASERQSLRSCYALTNNPLWKWDAVRRQTQVVQRAVGDAGGGNVPSVRTHAKNLSEPPKSDLDEEGSIRQWGRFHGRFLDQPRRGSLT